MNYKQLFPASIKKVGSIPNIVGNKITGMWHLIVLLTFDKTFENQGSRGSKEIKSCLSASEFF